MSSSIDGLGSIDLIEEEKSQDFQVDLRLLAGAVAQAVAHLFVIGAALLASLAAVPRDYFGIVIPIVAIGATTASILFFSRPILQGRSQPEVPA